MKKIDKKNFIVHTGIIRTKDMFMTHSAGHYYSFAFFGTNGNTTPKKFMLACIR